jgi:hypothetical protein
MTYRSQTKNLRRPKMFPANRFMARIMGKKCGAKFSGQAADIFQFFISNKTINLSILHTKMIQNRTAFQLNILTLGLYVFRSKYSANITVVYMNTGLSNIFTQRWDQNRELSVLRNDYVIR